MIELMEALLNDLVKLREDWVNTRNEFEQDMIHATNCKDKAEAFGWWDAACCAAQDLDKLIQKYKE